MSKPIKKGDYFLQPYKGRRRDLLVRAKAPLQKGIDTGYWSCYGKAGYIYLPSCTRVSPSLAARILGK